MDCPFFWILIFFSHLPLPSVFLNILHFFLYGGRRVAWESTSFNPFPIICDSPYYFLRINPRNWNNGSNTPGAKGIKHMPLWASI
jgi:hypothetical protein